MSRFTGLGLGDAVARVTRGASLWALVLSCFGVGTLLSLKATGLRFGGIATVSGLFFYGALLSLFTDEGGSSSRVGGAILFSIPAIRVICDGGPFSHLVLGHSVLHGLSAITAIMGLCLVQCERRVHLSGRDLLLLALPAFVVPVNSFAALYCLGVVFILLFWTRLAAVRSWLWTAVMFILFLSTWALMGYTRAPDAGGVTLKANLGSQWWTIAVWLFVGLGFRIFAFRWVSRPWRNPLAALVVATFLFLFSFSALLHLKDDNERYGLYFLQCMFSIFAFSRLTPTWWRSFDRSELIMDWLRLAKNTALLLSAVGVLIGVSILFTHQHTGIPSFRLKVLLCFLLAVATAGLLSLMTQKRTIAKSCSAILTAVLLVGFLAWITPWIDFGLGRKKMDVSRSFGEVRGLQRLHDLSRREDRFATNKHAVDTIPIRNQRSYGYTAFSERPVLLEGYLSRGETFYPWFPSLLQKNDLMFTTTDPETVHSIARSYNVHWLVARPGTDIALPRPLPSWLVEQQNCGDLKIYRVD